MGWCTPATGVTPGMPAPRAHDHLPVDRLAQDPVRAADVVGALGRDRRRLQAQPVSRIALGRLGADLVVGLATVLQREVEALDLDLDPEHSGIEHPQRLLEQLLPRLVAVERDYSDLAMTAIYPRLP